RESSLASVSPTGPAPTIRTSVVGFELIEAIGVRRFVDWIITSLFTFRVKRVAQTVSEKVERKQSHGKKQAGENKQPGVLFHAFGPRANEVAPTGLRGLYPEPEEADEGFQQHNARHGQGGIDDDDACHVWQEVLAHNTR